MVDISREHRYRIRPDNMVFVDCMTRDELAAGVRTARIAAGYQMQADAQDALSEAYPQTDFPRTFYGKFERMHAVPRLQRFEAICLALGLDIGLILPRLFLPDGSRLPRDPARRHRLLPALYGPDGHPLPRS